MHEHLERQFIDGRQLRGRIVRVGRARYAAGTMPRSTLSWRRARVRALTADPGVPTDRRV